MPPRSPYAQPRSGLTAILNRAQRAPAFVPALLSALALVMLSAPVLAAERAPAGAEQRARQFEVLCAKALPRGAILQAREEDWLQTVARVGAARIVLLDATKTRCFENHQTICGTGGCPVVLYSVSGTATRRLYDAQVLDWRVITRGGTPAFVASVHGARCDLPGNAACETQVDLATGAVTTRPAD